MFVISDKMTTFAVANGELAQLARAFEWHSKGRRFDSDILHKLTQRIRFLVCCVFCFAPFQHEK